MNATDLNTSASNQTSYNAFGANTFFGGLNPYYTGLLTEQYHGATYNGTEQPELYKTSNALNASWFVIQETQYVNSVPTNIGWTSGTSSLNNFTSNPNAFTPPFNYNGTTVKANASEFITGNYPLDVHQPFPSSHGIYVGNTISIGNTTEKNGTSPYVYQWYENYTGLGSSATSFAFAKAPDCGIGNVPNSSAVNCTLSGSAQKSGVYRFKMQVNDSSSSLQNSGIANSTIAVVSVGNAPSLLLSPNGGEFDSGQDITFNITAYGGIGPFAAELYNISGSKQQDSNITIPNPGGKGSVSFTSGTTGTFSYNAVATDQSHTPHYIFHSASSAITVNPDLTTPTLSPSSSQAILINTSSSQSVAFTASWSDGTPDYTARLYSSSTSTCNSGSTLVQTKSSLSSSSTTFSGVSPTTTTWYCVVVNDSASTPTAATSAAAKVVPFLRYVNITISNSQGSATPSPFQQLLDINSNDYKTYEAGNLDNVEFFTVSGQSINVIPSWLESGNSNSSTGTIYWIKLGSSISAHSDATVYMGMKSLGTNLFNGGSSGTTGEAPQLSGTYGEYDNGANVFNKYTNFSGTALPSSMSVLSGVGGSDTFSNYAQLQNNAGSTEGIYFTSAISAPEAVDTLVTSYTNTGGAPGVSVAEGESTSVSGAEQPPSSYGIGGSTGGTAQTQLFYEQSGGGSSTVLNQTSFPARPFVYTIAWGASGKETALQNYTTVLNSTNNALSLPSTYYSIIEVNGGAFSATAKYQWLRARAYPPNGVMPSASSSSGGVENIVVRKPSLITCTNPSTVKEANGTVMSVC